MKTTTTLPKFEISSNNLFPSVVDNSPGNGLSIALALQCLHVKAQAFVTSQKTKCGALSKDIRDPLKGLYSCMLTKYAMHNCCTLA